MKTSDYKKYDYRVSWSEEDQVHIARVAEFPSLAAHGDTPIDALRELEFVVEEVVKDLLDNNEPIPEPFGSKIYSGKLNLRMPEFLHRELVKEAAHQRVSLNQLIVSKLSGQVR